MKIAVLGDALLDLEILGCWDGDCPENTNVPIYKGLKPHVYAGGAANVASLLTSHKVSADLYCDGPGQGDRAWIGSLLKQVVRCNRLVWSNQGAIPVKIRGIDQNNVVACRIDAEEKMARKNNFPALDALLDDVRAGAYAAVIISDYCKGFINEHTEQVIMDILKAANVSVIDTKRKSDYFLWKHATAIVPNLPDSLRIFGTSDPCEIREMVGCKVAYVTRGKDSVLMGCADGQTEISVLEDIAQPYCVGAGDIFTVGVTMALAQSRSYIEAGMAGVKLAGEYVSRGRKSPLR